MTCAACNLDDTVYMTQGETKTLQLFVKRVDTLAAQDLTNCTVYMTVKARLDDIAPLIFKTSAQPTQIDILSPQTSLANTGRATITIAPHDTDNIQPGQTYWLDIWVVLPTGDERPVVRKRKLKLDYRITILP